MGAFLLGKEMRSCELLEVRHSGEMHDPDRVTYLGYANSRAKLRKFGIKERDRLSHLWVVGKTGVGKSTLLSQIASQDLEGPHGFLLLDPHGDLVAEVLKVAEERHRTVRVLDAQVDGWNLNPFAGVAKGQFPLAVAGLTETFKKIWSDEWGPRLAHIVTNLFWTLFYMPDGTLLEVPRLLSDNSFRSDALRYIDNPAVSAFWRYEFARWSPGFKSMALAPVQNKIGAILSDPRLRKVFSGSGEPLRLRQAMDRGDIILADLSKGVLGEGPSDLLGSLLLSRLALSALSRSDTQRENRNPFWVIADEFQSFGTVHTATMLGELRKYGVGIIAANQHASQLDPEIREALVGNAGTIIVFRVGAKDARYFAQEFSPTFSTDDFLSLPNFYFYFRLLIDGEPSRPLSAELWPKWRTIAVDHRMKQQESNRNA